MLFDNFDCVSTVLDACTQVFLMVFDAADSLPAMTAAVGGEQQDGMRSFFAAMMQNKWGQYGLVLLFFALIIWYLRFLFGPGGMFREKKWDEWNEQARLQEEAEKKAREEALKAQEEQAK